MTQVPSVFLDASFGWWLQVDVANKLAKRSGFPAEQVNFVVGDALAPALPDATYDVVLAIESSTYMPNKE